MEFNPYSPPITADLRPQVVSKPAIGVWLVILLYVHIFTLAVSLVYAFINIRSICISGIVVTVVGILLATFGSIRGQAAIAWQGFAAASFCAFIFALIALLRWGPPQAEAPVCILASIYSAIAVTLAIVVLYRRK